MKLPTHVAAQQLGVHPASLILDLVPMVGSIDDCWPEIDQGLVDTLKQLHSPQRPPRPPVAPPIPPRIEPSKSAPASARLSDSATRVLDKLSRRDQWGGNAVAWETLHNHFCQNVPQLRDAVEELLEAELLLSREGRSGPYSLNPARKGEIDTFVEARRNQR